MQPEYFGYNADLETYRQNNGLAALDFGRVIAEHKERYVVKTERGDLEAEITGNLRFAARSREDFPAVGDWVSLNIYDNDFAVIHSIFPRFSVIKRQAVGNSSEVQIIAVNVDYAFLVQALDRDFNLNRLERYLTICYASKVEPIVVLTKADLTTAESITHIREQIKLRAGDKIPVVVVSNISQYGMDTLSGFIKSGKTYCLLGSSGVGKSTLINNLAGISQMKTDAISTSTNKGRHTTSHRELIVLQHGGILIDNPGMREVGIADAGSGLQTTFDKIAEYAADCRFKDCTHVSETGCAVLQALENGEIDPQAYENYMKMEREKEFYESSVEERRKKDKVFGKIMKDYKKKDIKNRR